MGQGWGGGWGTEEAGVKGGGGEAGVAWGSESVLKREP